MAPYIQEVSWRIWVCCLVLLLVVSVTAGNAQSIRRQSIGAGGANMLAEGVLIKQTIGQSYATTASYSNEVAFQPGFQQPVSSQRSLLSQGGIAPLSISIYPNPATHAVNISSRESIKNGTLQVFDSKGRVLWSEKVAELSNYSLDCRSWHSGFYMISVVDEFNQRYSSKLLITK